MTANPETIISLMPVERITVRRWLLWGLVAYLMGVVTGTGYFTIGGVFALLSDLASVLMGLTMIPVVLGLTKMFNYGNPSLAQNAKWIGLIGFSLLTMGGTILSFFYFIRAFPGGFGLGMQFAGIFLQAVWLIMVGKLSIQSGAFPNKAAYAGMTAGAGYFAVGLSSVFGFNPISILASAAAVGGYILWTLWTRAALESKE
jgi:hypothetical protein